MTMPLLHVSTDTLIPLGLRFIPILAIMGASLSGIMRQIGRQRLLELAQEQRSRPCSADWSHRRFPRFRSTCWVGWTR